jgi:hypothetical protein
MENLQNAIQEGALAQMLNDAIADINYKSEIDLLTYNNYENGNLQKISKCKI